MKTIKGWCLKNKETGTLLLSLYPTKEYTEDVNEGDPDYEPVEITVAYD